MRFHFDSIPDVKRFYKECEKNKIAMVIYTKSKMDITDKIRLKYLLKESTEQEISYEKFMLWLDAKANFYNKFEQELGGSLLIKENRNQ